MNEVAARTATTNPRLLMGETSAKTVPAVDKATISTVATAKEAMTKTTTVLDKTKKCLYRLSAVVWLPMPRARRHAPRRGSDISAVSPSSRVFRDAGALSPKDASVVSLSSRDYQVAGVRRPRDAEDPPRRGTRSGLEEPAPLILYPQPQRQSPPRPHSVPTPRPQPLPPRRPYYIPPPGPTPAPLQRPPPVCTSVPFSSRSSVRTPFRTSSGHSATSNTLTYLLHDLPHDLLHNLSGVLHDLHDPLCDLLHTDLIVRTTQKTCHLSNK